MNPLKEIQQTVLQKPFERFVICTLYTILYGFFHSIGDIFNCLEGVKELLEPVKSKLQSASEKDKLVVKALSAVLLSIRHSINTFHTPNENENAIKVNLVERCSNMMKFLLKDWIVKPDVIGGSMFGGYINTTNHTMSYTDKEIKVHLHCMLLQTVILRYIVIIYSYKQIWEFMLLMKFGDEFFGETDDFILPVECEAEWHAIITFLVSARVAQVPSKEARVNLFCDLEKREDTPDILTGIFMTQAAEALDELIFNQVYYNYIDY